MAFLAQLVDDVVVHKFELGSGEFILGRHPKNCIVIDDSAVSAKHAAIDQVANKDFPDYKESFIEDLGSTNGTLVNGSKLSGRQQLHNNDVIQIAYNTFKFVDDMEVEMEKTMHILQKTKGHDD